MRRAPVLLLACLLATLAVGAGAVSNSSGADPSVEALKPAIKYRDIPFPHKRKSEMWHYSKRHYGTGAYKLKHPKVIVEHVAVAGSARNVRNSFASDHPDPELHELPNVCSHFIVNGNGRIYRFVTPSYRCRHTVGLNYTAIGIEHTGFKDSDVLTNRKQLRASLKLTRWLRCRYGITVKNVIGHNESLSSPYHHEKVRALRNQTHSDMKRRAMKKYRARLRNMNCQ